MVRKHPARPHLKAWRNFLGKTSQWVANEIGTYHSTILRYEDGVSGVDDATFAALAKAYGVSVAELSVAPADAPRAREMDRILRAIQQMDTEGLAAVAAIAERLKPAP
jgi:transcriptional regulator with XRE-family HTH domain